MIVPLVPRRSLAARSSVLLGLLMSSACLLPACGDDSTPAPPTLVDTDTAKKITISVDTATVAADDKSVATLILKGTTKGPLEVTATKGILTADDGSFGATLNLAGDGKLTLRSDCAGAKDTKACGGQVLIVATDAAGVKGDAKVTFVVKEDCANKVDDDGDKLIDCADKESCPAGAACGDHLSCSASGSCDACTPGEGKKVEATETTCEDGADNDCDGKVDCADSDCSDQPCSLGNGGLGRCLANTCQCAGSVEICGNKLDDDCDGKNDCDDTDCQPGGKLADQPCDVLGHTCSDKPNAQNDKCNVCGASTGTETVCGDAKDDDCDGKVDCADPDCAAQSCGGGPGQVCNDAKCVDTTTSYALELKPERPSIPADGKATVLVTVKITSSAKAPIENQLIDLTIEGQAKLSGTADPVKTQVKTNGSGEAQITLIGTGDAGFIKIHGTHVQTGNTADAQITVPSLASVSLTAVQFPVMGVRSSGYQEQSKLVYTLTGSDGLPYPAGLDVTFEHEPRGTSTIGVAGIPQPSCPGACTVSVATVSKADGKAEVTLYSGTVADVVSVRFKAEAAGQSIDFAPPQSIAIVGARANWYNMAVSCSPGNVPALLATNCTDSLIDEEVRCTVLLADRFKNKLGLAKIANFYSEAGVVGPPPTTPAYDPSKKPTEQINLGRAEETISTGGVLPLDVPPQVDEYSLEYTDSCGSRVHNPRDGIVSIIAAVIGEEGFVDQNGDGLYTDGEPFVDLGEPFVDSNDDGIHQPSEYFVDVDQSGEWTKPNGVWDSNTTIWTETRVTFSSEPLAIVDAQGKDDFSRWLTGPGGNTLSPAPTPSPGQIVLASKQLVSLPILFTDANFNPPGITTTYSDPQVTGDGVTAKMDSPILAYKYVEGHFLKQEFCSDEAGQSCASSCPAPGSNRCLVRTRVGDMTHFSAGAVALAGASSAGSWAVGLTAKTTGKKPGGTVLTKQIKIGISGATLPPP